MNSLIKVNNKIGANEMESDIVNKLCKKVVTSRGEIISTEDSKCTLDGSTETTTTKTSITSFFIGETYVKEVMSVELDGILDGLSKGASRLFRKIKLELIEKLFYKDDKRKLNKEFYTTTLFFWDYKFYCLFMSIYYINEPVESPQKFSKYMKELLECKLILKGFKKGFYNVNWKYYYVGNKTKLYAEALKDSLTFDTRNVQPIDIGLL